MAKPQCKLQILKCKFQNLRNPLPNIALFIFHFPFFILHFAIFNLLLGCATPQSSIKPSSLPSTYNVINTLNERAERLKTLKGIAKVEVSSSGGSIRGRTIILAKGDRFRLEFLGPMQQPIAILTYNGEDFAFLSHGGRLPLNIQQGTSHLPTYLLGWPMLTIPDNSRLSYDDAKGFYILESDFLNGGIQRLWIDQNLCILKGEVYGGDGLLLTQVIMGDFQEVDGMSFPFHISIYHNLISVSIDYEKVELNQEIDDGAFGLD